ncbi:glucokinase [Lentibacillus persicus]|uniref:Glucokinase n=1 Tax=Lentibacillus persicus TaxID=640948 RepID=A0A1I1T649_9BACI|nr:ROK family glucokinase [Lentibacillus persicus]SFD54085.1 glucokinase [Lentibacillus persicus]
MEKPIIGIDIGGTTVKMGLIDHEGNIISKWEIPTNKADNGTFIVSDIWKSISSNVDKGTIKGIGIGAPGFIDSTSGHVYEAVNIGWKNIDLSSEMHSYSGLPVYAANDANVAALGENWKGSGNRTKNLFALTLGTGVGGGVIVNGDILDGANGTAGEIGHTTVFPDGYLCNCGRRGCLETIASATGMVRQALEKIEQNPESELAERYRLNGSITTRDIVELAKNGVKSCSDIMAYTADVLGFSIANAAVILNPSKILIGGGVSKAGNDFIQLIEEAFRRYALRRVSEGCELRSAQLGNDAGIIGAAFLVEQNIENRTF